MEFSVLPTDSVRFIFPGKQSTGNLKQVWHTIYWDSFDQGKNMVFTIPIKFVLSSFKVSIISVNCYVVQVRSLYHWIQHLQIWLTTDGRPHDCPPPKDLPDMTRICTPPLAASLKLQLLPGAFRTQFPVFCEKWKLRSKGSRWLTEPWRENMQWSH